MGLIEIGMMAIDCKETGGKHYQKLACDAVIGFPIKGWSRYQYYEVMFMQERVWLEYRARN